MDGRRAYQVWVFCLVALLTCGRSPPSVAPAEAIFPPSDGASAAESRGHTGSVPLLDALARDTWTYLHSSQTTAHHLPYSWWSPALPGGDYANPAEIGLYALAWLAAYELNGPIYSGVTVYLPLVSRGTAL